MGIQEEKETQRATGKGRKMKELRYAWAEAKDQRASIYTELRDKVQRALIYTGYYYDTYGIGTPW